MPVAEEHPEDPLVELLLASYAMHPDDLAGSFLAVAERCGGADPVLWVADIDQSTLHRLGGLAPEAALAVDTTAAGAAYRDVTIVDRPLPDGRVRTFLPVLDSAERVGVLEVTLDPLDRRTARWWLALTSLLGELLVAKAQYGDDLHRVRRSAVPTLAAEMRLHWHPPTTFVSELVTIAGIFEPAYEIAGDTYDYAINRHIAHVALFDAMGHGLEASRMANLAVGSYRHSRREGLDLHQTVTAADAAIADQFTDERYVTGQVATLDTTTGELRVLNMGHPLPLHFRDGRFTGPVRCDPCLPLGLGGRQGVEGAVRLDPGDVVLFHTDGVTEARDEQGQPFGERRLAEMVQDLLTAGTRPTEALRRVVAAALDHQGRRARDDATMLLLGFRLPAVGPLRAARFE